MTTFPRYIDIHQPSVTVPAAGTLGSFTIEAPVPKQQNLIQQLGDGERKWTIKPQSEMPWSVVKELEIIKMTPYSTGSVKVVNHVAKLPRQSAVFDWNAFRDGSNPPVITFTGYLVAHSRWHEQVDLNTLLKERVPYHTAVVPDYSKELNEAKSKVVQKSMNGLDLLTNLAELPETLGMILSLLKAARHPLQSAKEVQERYMKSRRRINGQPDSTTKVEKLKELDKDFRNQWLQYRYGIMPLILSISDAIKLLDERFLKWHTEHSGALVPVSVTSKPMFNVDIGSYIYQNIEGLIKISTTGKAKYGTTGGRLSDLITANAFLTAWELIPLSFVIDWFVNVGDVIFSNTSALMDVSEQRCFCYSVKKEITTQTILMSSYDDTVTLQTVGNSYYGRPDFYWEAPLVHKKLIILRTETERSYDRVLFSPTDVSFELNPSLGWMRQLDAYALSFSKISKLLKKLR